MRKYIFDIKFEILLEIICYSIDSLASAGIAYLPKVFFDSVLSNVESNSIFKIIALYCLLVLISVVAIYFEMIFNWRFSVKFENAIKKDYFSTLIQYDDIEFHKRDVSDYISIQSNDIMQIEQDYLSPLVSVINQITRVIIFGLVMFLGIDYRIASVILILSLVAAFVPKYTGKVTSLKRLKFVNKLGEYTNLIYDFFTGFREINTRNLKNILKQHMSELNGVRSSRYNYGKSKSMSISINEFARRIVQITGFIMTVVLLSKGEISVGTGVATLGFIESFIEPLEETLYCFTTMETVKDVKDKVFKLLSSKTDGKKAKKYFQSNIELKNVCVHNGDFNLKNISLSFEKNKHYAIIGNNGSGKSTLLNSIMGYLPIDSGKILIDGENLLKFDSSWLITYVMQKSHIFSTDYNNNVTMFNSYNDLSEELIQKIGLSKELIGKIHNQGKSTELSGGEQQIVAYMRARNSETPILIMDEPFSAVDKHSKELLMKDIESLKDKTIIMITHDVDESLNYFDEVIKINNGSVV